MPEWMRLGTTPSDSVDPPWGQSSHSVLSSADNDAIRKLDVGREMGQDGRSVEARRGEKGGIEDIEAGVEFSDFSMVRGTDADGGCCSFSFDLEHSGVIFNQVFSSCNVTTQMLVNVVS